MRNAALILLAALAVFLAGVMAGMSHSSTSALKQEVKAEHVTAQQNATNVAKAQDASVKVEAKTAATAAAVDTNKVQIKKRVTAQIQRQAAVTPTENHPDETNPEASPARDGCGFSLDVGTVRMLNASRQGTAFDPARGGNEASDAAPALCFTDFIDADQDLTKLYLDLSERHNALVDSVEQFQSEQRSRLGIKEQKD
jgi:hypothetical protein